MVAEASAVVGEGGEVVVVKVDDGDVWLCIRNGFIVGMRTGEGEFTFQKPISVSHIEELLDSMSFLHGLGITETTIGGGQQQAGNDDGNGEKEAPVVEVEGSSNQQQQGGEEAIASGGGDKLIRFSNLPVRRRIVECLKAMQGFGDAQWFRAGELSDKLATVGWDTSRQAIGCFISNLSVFEVRNENALTKAYRPYKEAGQAWQVYVERYRLIRTYYDGEGSRHGHVADAIRTIGLRRSPVNIAVYHDVVMDREAKRSTDDVMAEINVAIPPPPSKEETPFMQGLREGLSREKEEEVVFKDGFCHVCGKKQVDECAFCTRGVCQEDIAVTIKGNKTELEYNVCSGCKDELGGKLDGVIQEIDAEFYDEFKDDSAPHDDEGEATKEKEPAVAEEVRKGRFLHVYEKSTGEQVVKQRGEELGGNNALRKEKGLIRTRKYGNTTFSDERWETLKTEVKKVYAAETTTQPVSRKELIERVGLTSGGNMNKAIKDICAELGLMVPVGKPGRKPRNHPLSPTNPTPTPSSKTEEVEEIKAEAKEEMVETTASSNRVVNVDHRNALRAMLGELPKALGEGLTGEKQACFVLKDGYVACRPRGTWVPYGGVCDICPNRVKVGYVETSITKYVVCDKSEENQK